MKAAHTVLYMKKHTQTYASYPAMDISCMSVVRRPRSRGRALYRDASRAGRLRTGPASFKGRDLELEGGVNACQYTSTETPTCEVPSNGVVEISLLPVCTVETSI